MTEKTNDVKSVSISDLKKMGKHGDATARLDSGEEIVLGPKYATQRRIGIIAGQVQEVDLIIPYTAQLISQIRTIKVGPILVARKQRKTALQLTGQGYKK
ncbi:hypothetical protein [Streptococcus sanguinis]|jgi:hypothetical protein|uniref:hypothetical protein n=1 Tax=Streptococcus sanguinis TaxID=1305 RepID=UPI000779747B|nr:hypothetical protein [Streptococcus sanguinis]RSI44146.1 hypothetical protein D8873_09275 [Streptococcus sanguinis]RSI65008.1 hypothetical protein D8861_08680 [Streptococcus sanguinis]